ncbi:lipase family protein [Vibrio harveyi]|uniref:lipase family protein n=1 Tax=Vibrio harveyi TaxID=669 RepID=UPI0032F5CC5A|nr:lipase family protein [Vibrio harveyi]
MTTLSPKLASELANFAYSIREHNRKIEIPSNILKHVEIQNRATSKTGGYIFNKETGFAALGYGKGRYKGDAIIAIRGTKMTSGHDWGTNAQIGLKGSDNGQTVHAGFQRTFSLLRPQLKKFLEEWHRYSNSGVVHCVGHSLGGALATLTADWLATNSFASNVNLYTFGAPRAGLSGFAMANTNRVNNIYRCTHGADVVPKVPLWPFVHSPYKGFEFRLDAGQGICPSAHGMDPDAGAIPGYLATTKKENWGTLQKTASDYLSPVRLDYDKRNQASYNNYWTDRLSAALLTLLKDAGYYTAVVAQAAISSGATLYDFIAQTLVKITEAGKTAASQVKGLLGHMLVFAGSASSIVKDLTFKTIRGIFNKMLNRLYRGVNEAIKRFYD